MEIRLFNIWCLYMISISVVSCCPTGWANFSSSCYLFHTDSRSSWAQATRICSAHRSHVVFIESKAEDIFIVNKLKHLVSTSSHHDSETAVWTGGTDEVSENSWMWYGDDTPITGYSNWYPGEPDAGEGEHEEDCICLVGNKHFQWQDYSCKKDMYFVCEKASSSASAGVSIVG